MFSIRGTENLGAKLKVWRQDWNQCNTSKKDTSFTIQRGAPSFIGYVIQQHNQRENNEGMTKGWQIFGNELEHSIQTNIIEQLNPIGQVRPITAGTFCIGKIPNLHSLIPYSMEARKPVFECTSADGLKGAHITRARESAQHFNSIVDALLPLM